MTACRSLLPRRFRDASSSLESRQNLLLDCLRSRRVLLVYDNLESFLEEGEDSGRMRAGYEGFARVLRRVAETEHQSCLLLTSREKPSDLVPLEGSRAPVRALRLARLDADACQQLLAEKGVAGSTSEQIAADRGVRGQSPGPQNRGADHRGALRGPDRPVPGAR